MLKMWRNPRFWLRTAMRDERMAARRVLAACDVAAERRRAAALDCAHHLQAFGVRTCGESLADRWHLMENWAARQAQNRRYR